LCTDCAREFFGSRFVGPVGRVRLAADFGHEQSADDQVGECVGNLAVGFEVCLYVLTTVFGSRPGFNGGLLVLAFGVCRIRLLGSMG